MREGLPLSFVFYFPMFKLHKNSMSFLYTLLKMKIIRWEFVFLF